jgi:hypothetical protein
MKSIANQYKDLKEGKMSQANFMRNLRMSMPQVTNVTSFGDAVKILKNKGIITENMVKANYEDPITLAKAVADAHPELQRFALEDRKMFQRAAFKYAAELMKSADLSDRVQMNLINGYADEDWPSDFISALGSALESSAVSENNDPEVETNNEDAEFDAILKQLEDEMAGEEAVNTQYDLEEGPEEEVEKAIQAKKIDPAVVKTAAEKAMRGDSTDLALLMVNAGNLNEAKETINPNKVHPQEYTMGIRYELKVAKGDVVKAERAVLKNLAKDSFYYTALKLAGKDIYKEAPSVKAEAPKKKSKKKEAELVDTINAMQKVKMPKKDEKKKIKENVDEKMRFQDLPADPEKYKIVRDSKNYIIKATNADGVEFQKGDTVKTYDGEEIKIVKFEESQGKVKAIYNKGMFFAGIDIDGLEAPKPTMRPGVDIGKSFEKFKSKLSEMVKKAMAEMYDGRDNLDAENELEEGYYEDIEGYTSVSDNGTGFKDNDKVKSKLGQEGFVYDVLKSKEGKALVVVKFQKNGMTTISKYGEGFSDINDISK